MSQNMFHHTVYRAKFRCKITREENEFQFLGYQRFKAQCTVYISSMKDCTLLVTTINSLKCPSNMTGYLFYPTIDWRGLRNHVSNLIGLLSSYFYLQLVVMSWLDIKKIWLVAFFPQYYMLGTICPYSMAVCLFCNHDIY